MSLKFVLRVVGLSAVLLSNACQSVDRDKIESLTIEDTVWELKTYLSVSGTMDPRVHKSRVHMTISDGKISGNAGANRFFGGVEIDGTSIKISTVGSSMMMGTPELMAQEGQFLKLLQRSKNYQIVDGELRMLDADGKTVMTFVPRIEPSLTSTVWKAIGVNNGKGGVSSLRKDTEINAEFTAEGRVSGTSGCNSYSGGYKLEGTSIVFSSMAGTRKMCAEPEGVMEQEMKFLQALEKSAVYSIHEDRLELRDASGALQVSFSALNE